MLRAVSSSTPSPNPSSSSSGCSGRRAGPCPSARSISAWAAPTATGARGVFREIVAPERVVSTEVFDEAWYPGECLNTTTFVEHAGKTTLTLALLYQSREARDTILKTPMEKGVAMSYDRLADLLASLGGTP
jgi:uncharacterized protein YndB with AHSA1/START domain